MRTAPAIQQPSEHHIQLFDSSKSLADTVATFLMRGFEAGENVLITATPLHVDLLATRLARTGWVVHDAIAANRLVVLDAAQTLDTFMRMNRPSPVAFDEVIGTAVRRVSNGRRVWIYCEMVDVLAAQGNLKAAQALERFWNDLGRRECFTLFCGYASGHFGDPRSAPALGEICKFHTHVHRKPDEILAEFLLEQASVKPAPLPCGDPAD